MPSQILRIKGYSTSMNCEDLADLRREGFGSLLCIRGTPQGKEQLSTEPPLEVGKRNIDP